MGSRGTIRGTWVLLVLVAVSCGDDGSSDSNTDPAATSARGGSTDTSTSTDGSRTDSETDGATRDLAGRIHDVDDLGPSENAGAARGHNVLLVTLDTTRADRLGCYGYPNANSRNIDRIAREGVLVERAMTVTPVTLPSHASILTGQLPTEHGVHDNGLFQVEDSAPLLSRTLKAEGYATAAFVSAYVLDDVYGIGQGFDTFNDEMPSDGGRGVGELERPAEKTVAAAQRWMANAPPEPWFLWLHLYDPHSPYEPPAPFNNRGEAYDGEIAYMDHHLGAFLKAYDVDGRLDRTVVAITSDHGEGLGEHGEETHGVFIYDTTMHVPLLLRHPSLGEGRRLDGQVSLVDLCPTILELIGLDDGATRAGRSFLAALDGDEDVLWRPAVLENHLAHYSFGVAQLEGIVDRDYKYIRAPRPELYEWSKDPWELKNRIDEHPEEVERLRDLWLEMRGDVDPGRQGPNRAVSSDEANRLAELGYVRRDVGAGELLDPKDFVRIQAMHQQVQEAASAGRLEQAEKLLREILEKCPNDTVSLRALGKLCLKRGARKEGLELLQKVLELRIDDWVAAFDLAEEYRAAGRTKKALSHYEHVLRYDPSNIRAALDGSAVALLLNEVDRARALLSHLEDRSLSVEDYDEFMTRKQQIDDR